MIFRPWAHNGEEYWADDVAKFALPRPLTSMVAQEGFKAHTGMSVGKACTRIIWEYFSEHKRR